MAVPPTIHLTSFSISDSKGKDNLATMEKPKLDLNVRETLILVR